MLVKTRESRYVKPFALHSSRKPLGRCRFKTGSIIPEPFLEGEGGGGGAGTGDAGAGAGAGDAGAGEGEGDKGKIKTFTQAQLNAIMAEDRRKHEEKAKQEKGSMLKELEELQKSANLSQKEREALNEQVASLEESLMTEQQKAERESKKVQREAGQKLEEARGEAKNWKTLFEGNLIENEILAAAGSHKAVNSKQIIDHVKPLTRIEAEKDASQKPTGKYVALITVEVEEEGEKVKKDISVDSYVEQLKGKEGWMNLFYADRISGSGKGVPISGGGVIPKGVQLSPSQKIEEGLRASGL